VIIPINRDKSIVTTKSSFHLSLAEVVDLGILKSLFICSQRCSRRQYHSFPLNRDHRSRLQNLLSLILRSSVADVVDVGSLNPATTGCGYNCGVKSFLSAMPYLPTRTHGGLVGGRPDTPTILLRNPTQSTKRLPRKAGCEKSTSQKAFAIRGKEKA
jgi:hypothetical protein